MPVLFEKLEVYQKPTPSPQAKAGGVRRKGRRGDGLSFHDY